MEAQRVEAIEAVVSLLTAAKDASTKEHAAAALAWLADGGKRPAIVEGGGVEALMTLLQGGGGPGATLQAARAIHSVAEQVESHPHMAKAPP